MFLFYLEIVCVLAYGAASALAAHGILREREGSARAARALFFAAVALHSAVIGIESTTTSGTLLSGPNIIMRWGWSSQDAASALRSLWGRWRRCSSWPPSG